MSSLYRQALLQHFRQPQNKVTGSITGATSVSRGSNPLCGDEVEVGVFAQGDKLQQVVFRGRGCSICIAASSMMTEAATGLSFEQARCQHDAVINWLVGDTEFGPSGLPESLQPLEAVREHPARHRCVSLAWQALTGALDKIES